ncbi:hypothetical protein C8T65DRAFT_62810 [Cerioporus squamosus]|nr:hypothetical protein C8T65DRAFT_62810 [Cerioporus squamosus]
MVRTYITKGVRTRREAPQFFGSHLATVFWPCEGQLDAGSIGSLGRMFAELKTITLCSGPQPAPKAAMSSPLESRKQRAVVLAKIVRLPTPIHDINPNARYTPSRVSHTTRLRNSGLRGRIPSAQVASWVQAASNHQHGGLTVADSQYAQRGERPTGFAVIQALRERSSLRGGASSLAIHPDIPLVVCRTPGHWSVATRD